MPKYIATQSIGQFIPGEEIKGLDAKRIQALLASGAIEEYQEPEDVKEERFHRFMELQQKISARRLAAKVGRELDVIVDEVDDEGAIGRSMADAPEIDGAVYLNGETNVKPGDIIRVKVENADEYDLWGSRV